MFNMSKSLNKLICILISIVMMLATIPLGRAYCGSDFTFYVYLFMIVWLFGIVPLIFLYMEKKNIKHVVNGDTQWE